MGEDGLSKLLGRLMDLPEINDAEPAWRNLADRAMNELRLKTEVHMGLCPLLEADWSINQDEGVIKFATDDLEAVASVQIIGTYNTMDETWLWSWANSSIVPELQRDALRLRDFGLKQGFSWFAERKLGCTEEEAWELTAIGCQLCDSQCAYRGPAGDTLVFVTFGDLSLKRNRPSL